MRMRRIARAGLHPNPDGPIVMQQARFDAGRDLPPLALSAAQDLGLYGFGLRGADASEQPVFQTGTGLAGRSRKNNGFGDLLAEFEFRQAHRATASQPLL